jgi:hypothetical protein
MDRRPSVPGESLIVVAEDAPDVRELVAFAPKELLERIAAALER